MNIRDYIEGEGPTNDALMRVRDGINTRLRDAIQKATLDLLAREKGEKLSGQVLNVKTGRLRRSITQRVETESDGNIVGLVGTNVSYGRAHELGFKGTVTVRAHRRNIKGKAVPVRAHGRNVNIPARPFLGPTLDERMPVYQRWMQDAIKEAIDGARS